MISKFLNINIQNIKVNDTEYSNIDYIIFLLINNIEDKDIYKFMKKNPEVVSDRFINYVIKFNRLSLFKKIIKKYNIINDLFTIDNVLKNLLDMVITFDDREKFIRTILKNGFMVDENHYDNNGLYQVRNYLDNLTNSKKSYTKILKKININV